MKIIKTSSGVVHRISFCNECAWKNGLRGSAIKNGKNHARESGHEIQIETCTVSIYSIAKAPTPRHEDDGVRK